MTKRWILKRQRACSSPACQTSAVTGLAERELQDLAHGHPAVPASSADSASDHRFALAGLGSRFDEFVVELAARRAVSTSLAALFCCGLLSIVAGTQCVGEAAVEVIARIRRRDCGARRSCSIRAALTNEAMRRIARCGKIGAHHERLMPGRGFFPPAR